MLTRIVSGVVLAAIVVAAWIAGGWWLYGLVYAVIIIAMYEMASSFYKNGKPISPVACAIFVIALPILLFHFAVESILWALGIAMMLAFAAQVFRGTISIDRLTNTAFVLVYPGCFVSLFMAMLNVPGEYSRLGLLLMVAVASMCDMMAYFTGYALGRHKLSPVISPKKTIEGSIGGILGGMFGAFVVWLAVQPILGTELSLLTYLFIGFVGSILGQIGDLAASLVKRAIGIKDYGKIIPGHGGIMDRIDSILFVAPLVYAVFVVARVG